jgi:hypothetical protein
MARQKIFSMEGGVLATESRDARAVSRKSVGFERGTALEVLGSNTL